MADEKLTQQTAATTLSVGDIFYAVRDPLTVPISRKITLNNLLIAINSLYGGWIPVTDAWAYASATTITVPSGAASLYNKGDKVRFKQGAGYKYFYIVLVADTLLTVTGGSDYTVATPAAITDIYCSKVSTPLDFPHFFNYTPTGVSAANVSHQGRFCIVGKACLVDYKASFTGGITFTTMPTLPLPCSSSPFSQISSLGNAAYLDSPGTYVLGTVFPIVVASATTVALVTAAAANISATVPITWANGDILESHFEYEI
jgi:hypothetical protein